MMSCRMPVGGAAVDRRRDRADHGAVECAALGAPSARPRLGVGRYRSAYCRRRARHRAQPAPRTTSGAGQTPASITSPFDLDTINAAWCVAATIATDLLSRLRLLCLDTLADADPRRCATASRTSPCDWSADSASRNLGAINLPDHDVYCEERSDCTARTA
jgi:hypothetical protein